MLSGLQLRLLDRQMNMNINTDLILDDILEPQVITDEQHLQELRQRINAKAENMVKWRMTEVRKQRWAVITILAVLIAIIIAIEIYSYLKNEMWEFNGWVVTFIAASLITDRIMSVIMRRYLTRMKNASTAPHYYREVKRLITTHKLRQWIPCAVALICSFFVKYGAASWSFSLVICSSMVIGTALGASMRNWFLDDDFCFDVEELGDMINQESAT